MSGELLQRKGEFLRVTRMATESSALALELSNFNVKWYHALYDKEIKQFEERLKSDFAVYSSTCKHFNDQVQIQEEGLDSMDKTLFSMLSVSGHMYAESMNMLKIIRYRSLVLCGIAINLTAFLFFGLLTINAWFG